MPLIGRRGVAIVLLVVAIGTLFHSRHLAGLMSRRAALLCSVGVLGGALLLSGWWS